MNNMNRYHKIICPLCKHEFVRQNESSLMHSNHIECPKCRGKFSSMEIKRTKSASTWDIIKSFLEL